VACKTRIVPQGCLVERATGWGGMGVLMGRRRSEGREKGGGGHKMTIEEVRIRGGVKRGQ